MGDGSLCCLFYLYLPALCAFSLPSCLCSYLLLLKRKGQPPSPVLHAGLALSSFSCMQKAALATLLFSVCCSGFLPLPHVPTLLCCPSLLALLWMKRTLLLYLPTTPLPATLCYRLPIYMPACICLYEKHVCPYILLLLLIYYVLYYYYYKGYMYIPALYLPAYLCLLPACLPYLPVA